MAAKPAIVAVDDDAPVLRSIERDLRARYGGDYRVVTAGSGADAIELVAELTRRGDPVALFVVDQRMPVMTGIELLTRLKASARFRRLPVVMLTTSKDDHDKASSFENCVAGYMVKPVDYQEFVDLMRTLFTYWSLSEPAA